MTRCLVAFLLLTSLGACQPMTKGPPIESTGTGVPSAAEHEGNRDANDDGGAACVPQLADFVPAYHPPVGLHPSCSGPQIRAYYEQCFGTNLNLAECADWQAAAAECNNCLLGASSPTGAAWGPLVAYATRTEINQGGCIATEFRTDVICAQAAQEAQECEHAACDGVCASPSDEEACLANAEAGACLSYVQTASEQCDFPSACFRSSDEETWFITVASAFCL